MTTLLYLVSICNVGQCRIKGVLGVLQHLGPQFWSPQLVRVENFYVLL